MEDCHEGIEWRRAISPANSGSPGLIPAPSHAEAGVGDRIDCFTPHVEGVPFGYGRWTGEGAGEVDSGRRNKGGSTMETSQESQQPPVSMMWCTKAPLVSPW